MTSILNVLKKPTKEDLTRSESKDEKISRILNNVKELKDVPVKAKEVKVKNNKEVDKLKKNATSKKYKDPKKSASEDKKKIKAFEEKWIRIMAHLGLYNKLYDVYSLNFIESTFFGFVCKIYIAEGLNYAGLEKNKDAIEDGLGCMMMMTKPKRSNMVHTEFVFTTPEKLKFDVLKGIEYYPWELYLGNGYNSEPTIVDMVKRPHVLITGGTRSGKQNWF